MRICIFGASGFVGKAVAKELSAAGHDVFESTTSKKRVNLLYSSEVEAFLIEKKPEVIINAAGIIGASETVEQNYSFTASILQALHHSGLKVRRVIIMGSAAEYGTIAATDLPVNEYQKVNPQTPYGHSKAKETNYAVSYGAENGIPVTIARLFNPIGVGMKPKFLIVNLINQVEACLRGESEELVVSRLDSRRDYIDIRDVASAIRLIIERDPKQQVYNIGSGRATSNAELAAAVIKCSNSKLTPNVRESSKTPEALVATQANIKRLSEEFDWKPNYRLEDSVKEMLQYGK